VSRADEQRIDDILDAASQVIALAEVGKEAWDADRVRQLAVERLLEIIGESARAMSNEGGRGIRRSAWSDVIGLRTVLAHHYHRVDPDQVWTIATKAVPALATQLRAAAGSDDRH
jgi:uncharacterized protein with HEPN domain